MLSWPALSILSWTVFQPDQLVVRPSLQLAALLALIQLLALAAVIVAVRPWWAAVLLVAGVVMHGVYLYRRYYRLSHSRSVHRLCWDEQGWQLQLGDGRRVDVTPSRDTVLMSRLQLLYFRESSGRRCHRVPLCADSGDADSLRRLQVRLRFSQADQSV